MIGPPNVVLSMEEGRDGGYANFKQDDIQSTILFFNVEEISEYDLGPWKVK